MNRGALLCVFLLVLYSFSGVCPVEASEHIFIHEDGSVEPGDAPIQRMGSLYYLTGNTEERIVVNKSDIVLDGKGYQIAAGIVSVSIEHEDNVTVMNCVIKGGFRGIWVDRSSHIYVLNNTVTKTSVPVPSLQSTGGINFWYVNYSVINGNHLSDNYRGIGLGYSYYNQVVLNNLTNNQNGIRFWEAYNNSIYGNNVINNTQNAYTSSLTPKFETVVSVNSWDNGTTGNYWSDYNGTDTDGDGIGDTPYTLDGNNTDRYPLMNPIEVKVIPELPSFMFLLLLLVLMTVVSAVYARKTYL